MTEESMVERVARAMVTYGRATATAAGGGWHVVRLADKCSICWCDNAEEAAAKARAMNARAAIACMREPTEAMWGGLARDIIMWMDMHDGPAMTPRNLFRHLERIGREIPQWLRDEPELCALDHVPSKGTRAAIIYRAQIDAALKETP